MHVDYAARALVLAGAENKVRLHALLSDVTYPSLAGLNVPGDTLELASQWLERYAATPEVLRRFIMDSTDGPLESAMIRCPAGHVFNGPIEFLSYDKRHTARRSQSADRGAGSGD